MKLFKKKKNERVPKQNQTSRQQHIRRVNSQEYIASSTYKRRASHFWSKLGIHTAHKTRFTFVESIALLILWLGIGRLCGYAFSEPYYLITGNRISHVLNKPLLMFLTFVVVEIIPTLITIFLVANRKHFQLRLIPTHKKLQREYRINHHTKHVDYDAVNQQFKDIKNHRQKLINQLHWVFLSAIIRWIKIFWHDLITHKALVCILFCIMEGIDLFASSVFTLLAGPVISSPNTENIMTMAKQFPGILLILVFVSPVVEELLFRCLIPKIFYGLFDKIVSKGNFMIWKYWFSAFLSALIFASLHESTTANWGLIASYVVFALIQQLIRKETGSITIPVFTHSISNVLAILVNL